MRIAVPLDNGQVADHMGHCPAYLVAEIQDNKIIKTAELTNPRHGPGGPPPVFLANLGVSHVVGWGAPEHFQRFLAQLGLTITLGARGNALEVLNQYLAGTLQTATEGIEVHCNHNH